MTSFSLTSVRLREVEEALEESLGVLHQALVHVGRLLQLVQLLHEAVCDTHRVSSTL